MVAMARKGRGTYRLQAPRTSVQDFVKATAAPYKYPRAVEFREALPRTEMGKLQRFRVRGCALAVTELPGTPCTLTVGVPLLPGLETPCSPIAN